MDIVSQFEELKNAKKTQETLDGLNELLSVAKQEKDSSLALDISLQIVEVMRYLRMHDQVISWLEKELDSDFFTSKEDCLKIIDELIKTLLRTEDFLKLESVLFHRERFLTNDHQKVMQKFYFAVCYEGLKDYKKAIDTLKSIKDTISASNLVSKYLKLSMLYLKENDLSKAKENLDHAAKFDYRKTNPIFLLAESDILFFENDYLNSLVKYQEYFVKSKNKHRYLDRYILINIKLNKLDEAWRFYQEYMPSMSQVISKNYRLIFYEAGYLLAEALNNKEEQDKLRFLIDELEPIPPMLNQFDSVYRLLSIAFQNKVYKKPREIIHHLFKALDSLYKFQKMIYVVFDGDQALIYHYSKGLLLEKETHLLTLADSILGNILKTKPTNDLYGYDDLIKYSHHLYQTVETAYVFSDGIERRDAFDYFIVYSKEKSDFDIQQKLVLLATEILKKQMNDFDRYHDSDIVSRQITNLVDLSKDGLIKIENNTIHFLNQSAKEIFGMETDYLAFDVFQTYLEEIVFIDDFLNKESVSLKLKDSDKQLTFLLSEGEYTIYALVKEAKTDSLVQSINAFTNLPDERQLLMDNLNTESKTVMLIEIRNYLEHFSHYSHERYKERLDELTEFIRQTSKNHFDCIYLESYHLLYLTLKSIDKRVINRISDAILAQASDFDLHLSIIQFNHQLTKEKLVQLRSLLAMTSDKNKVIFDSRNFRYNQELAKTLLINLRQLIEKKSVMLSYQEVADWQNQEIAYYLVGISAQAMLGESEVLFQVVHSHDLESEWDYLVACSLAKEIKTDIKDKQFIMPICAETLSDKKQLGKITRKLADLKVAFLFDMSEDFDFEAILQASQYLKDKDIELWGKSGMDRINRREMDIFMSLDVLVISSDDLASKHAKELLDIVKRMEVSLVFDHEKKSLRKSSLEHFGIRYVFGDAYQKYESVTALKKESS